jgi:hypothetical protein
MMVKSGTLHRTAAAAHFILCAWICKTAIVAATTGSGFPAATAAAAAVTAAATEAGDVVVLLPCRLGDGSR